MPIVRSPRLERDFTIISNAVLRDERLTYRARGVLAAILSRPDDWRTDSATLSRQGGEGREAVRKALNELEQHGYLIRRKKHDDAGRWVTESFVYDTPQETAGQTEDGFPGAGFPGVGNVGAIRSTETEDLEGVGRSEDDSGLPAGSPLRVERDEAVVTKKLPRQRNRKPLTAQQREASWARFRDMDLDFADVQEAANAFVELEVDHGAYEPDRFAQYLLDRNEWDGFVGSTGLGSNREVELIRKKSA